MTPLLERGCTMTTTGQDETQRIGQDIGRLAQAGDVVLLVGQLGAGKTCLTQGIGQGLDVSEPVNSPTFVLLREYHGRLPLYHCDVYRLSNIQHTVAQEWREYLCGDGVAVMEWADLAAEDVPAEHLLIEFGIDSDTTRTLSMTAVGARHCELLDALSCS